MRDFNWLINEMKISQPETLIKLRCPNYSLGSFDGIERFEKLEYLNCSKNRLKNLKGVERLLNLKTLIANDNFITDFSNLKDLPLLSQLEVADNKLVSLSGMEDGFKTLNNLSISGNGIDKEIIEILNNHRGMERLREFLKENPIYSSVKVGNLKKTGVFENVASFEEFLQK